MCWCWLVYINKSAEFLLTPVSLWSLITYHCLSFLLFYLIIPMMTLTQVKATPSVASSTTHQWARQSWIRSHLRFLGRSERRVNLPSSRGAGWLPAGGHRNWFLGAELLLCCDPRPSQSHLAGEVLRLGLEFPQTGKCSTMFRTLIQSNSIQTILLGPRCVGWGCQ